LFFLFLLLGQIMGLRRAKKRNMERLVLACGGRAVDSVEDLTEDDLGYAGLVYEHVLGRRSTPLWSKSRTPTPCTILVKGTPSVTVLSSCHYVM